MSKRLKTLAAACAVLAVAACSPAEPAPAAPPSKLLWMGDSVAEGLAGPLAAAAQAGGLPMESIASTGGGNVSGIEELTKST